MLGIGDRRILIAGIKPGVIMNSREREPETKEWSEKHKRESIRGRIIPSSSCDRLDLLSRKL